MGRTKRINYHPLVGVFAERLRTERKRRGMSQQALAFKAGVNVGFVGKLERSEASPSVDTVGWLADALGIPADRLLFGKPVKGNALAAAREQVQRHLKRLANRDDAAALQAISVVLGLVDNALARRRS